MAEERHRLPAGTATARLADAFDEVRAVVAVTEETDVRDCLGGTTKATAFEETVCLGGYGKILTVLSSGAVGREKEDKDDADEDDLIERWTPRLR